MLPGKEWHGQHKYLTPEEHGRIIEIQDLLIERFVEHKEALREGNGGRAKELEAEINNLLREKETVEEWAAVGSAEPM